MMTSIPVYTYTAFMRAVVELARGKVKENVTLLESGFFEEGDIIKQLFEGHDVVIGLWDDPSLEFGVGTRVLKGAQLLRDAINNKEVEEYSADISVIPCRGREHALAIEQEFRNPDEDEDEGVECVDYTQGDVMSASIAPIPHHMLWPGVPVWDKRPLARATTTRATFWMSFATDNAFCGVIIQDEDAEACLFHMVNATQALACFNSDLRCAEMQMQKLPPNQIIPQRYKNRLLGKDEVEQLLNIQEALTEQQIK